MYIGKVPAIKVINSPTMIVAFSPINLIRNGLTNKPMTIPILGIVDSISTPGKALYISGNAGAMAGAIIKKIEIDSNDILKIR